MIMTRRRFAVTGGATLLAIDALAQTGQITAARSIHQEEDFDANPARIYEALLDAKQFRAFSGMGADIDRTPGGTFKLFDGQIAGRNIELTVGRLIVQAWRSSGWPEGIFSIARFDLTPRNMGTRIVFDHTGFPPEAAERLASGWTEHYWTRLRKYLA
ncbi:MAG TPA: SRPBCC domain-containing protein [Bryobacteraceae bacterium]